MRRQGIFWLLTIKADGYTGKITLPPTSLPEGIAWILGQQEIGGNTGYRHWQIFVAFSTKQAVAGVRKLFGQSVHAELSRSEAAASYCLKADTAVDGSQFEFGAKPIRRNVKVDWNAVWDAARERNLDAIPPHIRVCSYRQLLAIGADHEHPVAMLRETWVFWGDTGTGKSYRAFNEAGPDCYVKDPRTKFWCGYSGQTSVVIDEFRGGIDIAHLLRWLDRYPVRVEIKGSSRALNANKIWITSNMDPRKWYPELDSETLAALLRRLTITHFNK